MTQTNPLPYIQTVTDCMREYGEQFAILAAIEAVKPFRLSIGLDITPHPIEGMDEKVREGLETLASDFYDGYRLAMFGAYLMGVVEYAKFLQGDLVSIFVPESVSEVSSVSQEALK